ncbi:MAG TPA: serine/threonine-protein kinase, partial [Caulobacteraceae bacterium]|nr:serine/threonine-protein kinase [Caulobacteraceae bacterium]
MAREGDERGQDPGRALYERLKAEREARERTGEAPAPAAENRTVFYQPKPAHQGQLPIGTQLNHIYEIRRYIARGGMGEVYEGVNLATEERVAIKLILKHLADDPNVNAIFRKEARTHTRLIHPALAQYRMATREPTLGVFYIVTEFVDGVSLEKLIGDLIPSEGEIRGLIRRLAEGLRAAHELGAIHRDISPDNILVPQRRLELAKIIDFGIAKDVQATAATIVGNTFAGKLNYVAPEQFGDFGREIGPWTDIYSLGLVMVSLAQGRPVNMGQTLVEAVDRRRAGVDLSEVSPTLQPLFARMLAADPRERFRSMDEVLDALGRDVDVWVDTAPQFSETWSAAARETTVPPSAPVEPAPEAAAAEA